MLNKLIFKAAFDKENKDSFKIDTEIDNWKIELKEPLGETIEWAIRMSCYDYDSETLVGEYDKLKYLKTLIVKYGFKLTLREAKDTYRLFIHKPSYEITFETTKDNKIETLFVQAEEWAETLLEDLKINTACGLKV